MNTSDVLFLTQKRNYIITEPFRLALLFSYASFVSFTMFKLLENLLHELMSITERIFNLFP